MKNPNEVPQEILPVLEESGQKELLTNEPEVEETEEIVSIEEFIELKKLQNKVLEKIIESINQSEKKV